MHPKKRPPTRAEKRMLRSLRKLTTQGLEPALVSGTYSRRIALALVRRGEAHAAISRAGELAVSVDPAALLRYPDRVSPRQDLRALR